MVLKGKRYYFSPPPTSKKTNEYVNNFFDSLCREVPVVNYHKKAAARSLDYFKYSLKTDVMILNWPEDILHLRFGIIQLFLSFVVFISFRLRGGKLIWICHNKDSHTKKYKALRTFSRYFFTVMANKIIVHSEDALIHFAKSRDKVYFLTHPVYDDPKLIENTKEHPEIDVLIWGKIAAYKGLKEFIENYKKKQCNFNVFITGEANKNYLKELNKVAADTNVQIKDNFITDQELESYFNNCRIILLPYLDSDTFSSGALIHSLNSNKLIVGPNVGNFIDVKKAGACLTYTSQNEMFDILKRLLNNTEFYKQQHDIVKKGIEHYRKCNTWHNFIESLLKIINSD